MADLFVSYASEDRERIRPLVEEFERRGWSVWWDRTLHAGPRFDDEIERALDAARCVVVVWSAHSLRSDWVRNEASEGLARGILVPAAIDAVTPPLAFRQNQTAQLVGWPGSQGDLDRLLAGVRAVLSNGAPSGEVSRDTRQPTHPKTRRRWWVGAALAVTAAAALLFALALQPSRVSEHSVPRTAVFAFSTPSDDASAADLSRAIENEVVETMDAIGLAVISRSGIGAASDSERAARLSELGAEYVVDGEIRREDGNLVVSARIEAPKSSTILWTNSYRGADPLFRTLVQRYPDSAGLNAAFAITIVNSLGSVPATARVAFIAEARAAADHAMSLDPKLPDSYLALFSARSVEGAAPEELRAFLVEGLRLAPDHPTLNAFFGDFLQNTGRVAEAQPYLRRALAGDPLSAAKPWMLATSLEANGQPTQSEAVLRDAAIRWPDDLAIWALRMHLAVFSGVGDVDALLAATPSSISRAASCWRAVAAAKSAADADARRRDGTDAVNRCLEQGLIDETEAIGIAAALGNVDDAFARAEGIESWRELSWPMLFANETRQMRSDDRFMSLIQRLGYIDLWRDSGTWPDFCRLPDLPYDCDALSRVGEIAAPPPAA